MIIILMCALGFLFGFALRGWMEKNAKRKTTEKVIAALEQTRASRKRLDANYKLAKIKENKIDLSEFFRSNAWHNVAIYGYSKLGQAFMLELEKQGMQVDYIIDQNASSVTAEKKVYSLDDELPATDVIVVCIPEAAPVRELLREKKVAPSVALLDLLELLCK